MILPKNNNINLSLNTSKINTYSDENFGVSLNTKHIIVIIIESLIENEIEIERLNNILNNIQLFNVEKSFELIKSPSRKYISFIDVEILFNLVKKFILNKQLFFYRFRNKFIIQKIR